MELEQFISGMSNREKQMFKAAYAAALASDGVGGNHNSAFRLGAVIADKGKIVASAFNSKKSHPMFNKLSPWHGLTRHAEQAAILNCGLSNCYGLDIFICRVKRDKTIGLAKPCPMCQSLIEEVGFKRIYYTQN